ncbi:hypothetical protein RIF29_08642 [Crotalaria pallida]|uniref:Uncharacterized protein n=1 Tax=Crotalaria pallida TaxID=3830 RepID=A0AAN9FR33_CROPI
MPSLGMTRIHMPFEAFKEEYQHMMLVISLGRLLREERRCGGEQRSGLDGGAAENGDLDECSSQPFFFFFHLEPPAILLLQFKTPQVKRQHFIKGSNVKPIEDETAGGPP